MTELDRAHAAMEAAPEDTAARMRYYAALADCELLLVLADAQGDRVRPRLFPIDGVDYALVFDTDLRMVEFCGDGTEYLAAAGRQVAQLLRGRGIGLAVNAGAPSALLLPPEALDWLAEALEPAPEAASGRPRAVSPPGTVPEALRAALAKRLAGMAALVAEAWLVRLAYADRPENHALLIAGATEPAQPAIAGAVAEALRFSGLEAGALDVVFLRDDSRLLGDARRVGLDLGPPREEPPRGPGMDPDRPPRLR